jgi:acetyl esterase/lipase
MPLLAAPITRSLQRRRFLFLTITIGIAALWYLVMSYTPNTVPDLQPLTFAYKTVQGLQIHLDIYPPPFAHHDNGAPNGNPTKRGSDENPDVVPALLYFHGGGLTVGDRKSWFPQWMQSQFILPLIVHISTWSSYHHDI